MNATKSKASSSETGQGVATELGHSESNLEADEEARIIGDVDYWCIVHDAASSLASGVFNYC